LLPIGRGGVKKAGQVLENPAPAELMRLNRRGGESVLREHEAGGATLIKQLNRDEGELLECVWRAPGEAEPLGGAELQILPRVDHISRAGPHHDAEGAADAQI
jgi:hypothetical protein